jgi:hypothetical protein
MNKPMLGLFAIKLGCLLFWFGWFSLACLSNLFDMINALYGLPAEWHFVSGNYVAVAKVISIYSLPDFCLNLLFSLDILIQAACALLFFLAAWAFWKQKELPTLVNYAFGLSMGLWAAFILMDELFIAYAYEGTHLNLFAFELLTLLALHELTPKKLN